MTERKFVPKPGQIDFTNIRYAPVINCVVFSGDKVLLVRRSPDMRLYPGVWNGISGFLDDNASIEDKVREELLEEVNITAERIERIMRGTPLLQEAPDYNKTWLVVPVRVEVRGTDVTTNWEAKAAAWFAPEAVWQQDLMPGFDEVLLQFMPGRG